VPPSAPTDSRELFPGAASNPVEFTKVAVDIEFRVRDASRRRSSFAPLWSTSWEAGETLAQNVGTAVTFVVFIIP